jgi:DHA2 family multidrug resistance protein
VAERRDQLHQSNVGALITATSQQLAAQTQALADYLVTKGFTGADAALAAQGRVLTQLERQVHLLSFMDCFRVLGYVTVAVLPLVLAIRHIQSAGKAPVVE